MRFEKLPGVAKRALAASASRLSAFVRYGGGYRKFLNHLAGTRGLSKPCAAAIIDSELSGLLLSARAGSRFNQERIGEVGDLEIAVSPLAVLSSIKPVAKSELREAGLSAYDSNHRTIVKSSTSGTSGMPMTVGHARSGVQRRFAAMHDHLGWWGIAPSAPSIRLSGRILFDPAVPQARPWLYLPSDNQVLLSTYHLTADHSAALERLLQRFRPVVIDGYPSAVFDLARLLDPVLFDSVELVVTTAETLDDGVRASISEIMGCGVVEYYSASEGLPLIQQCKYGTYHVRWQTGICEVLDDAGVHCAGDGELVVTSFVQPRVPLIRYRTGDLVYGLREWSTECSCGLAGPTAEGLGGRREDTVLTRSGNRLGMFTYRTLKKIHGLGETQVVQRGLDDFLVKSVLPDAAKRQMLQAQIEESFCATLGYPVSVELCAVPRIERGAGGKVRLVVSHV